MTGALAVAAVAEPRLVSPPSRERRTPPPREAAPVVASEPEKAPADGFASQDVFTSAG